ncbi:MAG: hypothetical protein AAGK74_05035 [Chloroflexota bacterium]
MTDDQYTPADTSVDELATDSRYLRPRMSRLISWPGMILGVLAGFGAALYFAWVVSPLELTNIHPRQLDEGGRAQYTAMVAVSYAEGTDIDTTVERLLVVVPPGRDPFQEVADVACDLAQSGYGSSTSGIEAIRAMKTLYQLQLKTSCADDLVLVAAAPTQIVQIQLATPTPPPPPTKTPTVAPPAEPTPTAFEVFVPTPVEQDEYVLITVSTYCRLAARGLIEVYVQDFNGQGIPGQPVRARWNGGEDVFYTGLKPEISAAYADFEMENDVTYTIDMPDRSEPGTRQLQPVPCNTETGEVGRTSYRATFRPTG